VAVVIDVLRATTTALAALEAGIPSVRAVPDLDAALALRKAGMLVAGEREGLRVEGFDYGNSPIEIAAAGTAGKPLALCSTNGSRALLAPDAEVIFAGCIRNAGATAAAVLEMAHDGGVVLLQGSGQDGAPTAEDAIAAGAVIEALSASGASLDLDGEAERARRAWSRVAAAPADGLLCTPHGQYLASLGFEEDVRYAAILDASPHAVCVREGVLTLVPRRVPD